MIYLSLILSTPPRSRPSTRAAFCLNRGDGIAENFYKSGQWQRTRSLIIARDNNECQNCKKFGKVKRGNTVHHIKPLDLYPDLALDEENLITLCNTCHERIHDRGLDSGDLTRRFPESWT